MLHGSKFLALASKALFDHCQPAFCSYWTPGRNKLKETFWRTFSFALTIIQLSELGDIPCEWMEAGRWYCGQSLCTCQSRTSEDQPEANGELYLGARRPGSSSILYHWWPTWLWVRYLHNPGLSFLSMKWGAWIKPPPKSWQWILLLFRLVTAFLVRGLHISTHCHTVSSSSSIDTGIGHNLLWPVEYGHDRYDPTGKRL